MEDYQTYWWREDTNEINTAIFSYNSFLEKHQPYVLEEDRRHLKLYGNADIFGLGAKAYRHSRVDRLKLNIIKAICDTATAKIAKNKVKPTFLTSGGDQTMQDKAKKLEKFAMGQLYCTKYYQKSPSAFLDATVMGTGALKIYRIGKKICMDRVLKPELRVDSADALYGEPRTLFQVKFMAREVVLDMFPEYEREIKDAPKEEMKDERIWSLSSSKADLVKVIEAWHLRSGEMADDGRHVIAIENKTLFDEKYSRDYFPFAFVRWSRSPSGFWGVGLAEILTGIQIEINKVLKENQDIFHLCDIPQIWIEAGSKIVESHFDNEVGAVHTYTGTPPITKDNGTVSQQRFQYLIWLIQSAFEVSGISQLTAQSKLPAGLEGPSGRALRIFHDIETERFAMPAREWEQFCLDVVRQQIDLAREIDSEEEGGYSVLVGSSRNKAEEIQWKDINLEKDKYIMNVYPTNLLSDEPAGRLKDVQELMQAGLYGPEEGRKLLDFPDTESLNSLLNADQEDIMLVIEEIRDKGTYHPPEPFQNLQLGIGMVQRAYLRAKVDQVPEARLELFRRWIGDAVNKLQAAQQPPPQPEMAPQAKPEPQPTSELMPNVPGPTVPQ